MSVCPVKLLALRDSDSFSFPPTDNKFYFYGSFRFIENIRECAEIPICCLLTCIHHLLCYQSLSIY